MLRYDLEGAGIILGAGLIGALWAAARQRPDIRSAALAADDRLGLRERLTSSLELADIHDPMVDAVHQDALRHLDHVNPRRDFPLLPTRTTKWLALPLFLFGAGYLLLPEFDLFGFEARALEARVQTQVQQAQAERLEKVAKALQAPDKIPMAALDSKALELESLSEQLQAGTITEKQALARVKNLRDALAQDQKALESRSYLNKAGDKANASPFSKGLSRDLQQGNVAEARKKMAELQKKLADNQLSEKERQDLASDLKEMAKELEQNSKSQLDDSLAAALSKAAAALSSDSPESMGEAMERLEQSEKDMESVLNQLAQLDKAMAEMKRWEKDAMGASPFCRDCGAKLEPCTKGADCEGTCEGKDCEGACGSGSCSGAGYQKGLRLGRGQGPGMGGAGQGRGNRVGDLPDVDVAMTPSMLPGEVNEGKMLASVVQRTSPDEAGETRVQIMQGTIVQAQQEAEEALTREEIPRGSEEFVRQYFGTLEVDSETP